MASEERNALAELANALVAIGIKCDDENAAVRISQAQRIIAELAKVKYVTDCDGNRICLHGSAFVALEHCCAIAEE